MRKITLILFCTLFSAVLWAQSPHKVYSEIVGTRKFASSKVSVEVDLGQVKRANDKFLVDENGKRVIFNSMIDALNFMSEQGWEFEQAYIVTQDQQNIYHYVLSKEIEEDGFIRDGLKTKKSFKEQGRRKKKNKDK